MRASVERATDGLFGLARELINGALNEVDWQELGRDMLDEVDGQPAEGRTQNLAVLERAVDEKAIEIDGFEAAAENSVLLLVDVTADASEPVRLSVRSVHKSRREALSSIESDGVNCCPRC